MGRRRFTAAHRRRSTFVLRNVAGHHWGWFSREDQRMHVQTVSGTAKVWLETRGARTFEPALGKLSAADWNRLRAKVDAERDVIESRWIGFMFNNGWIHVEIQGSNLHVVAYPGSRNTFARTIDLRRIFPGAYRHAPTWAETPPKLTLDKSIGLLAIGQPDNPDNRDHLDLAEFLFTG